MGIAAYIDHTFLKPTTTLADIEKLCLEAAQYGFAAVCVPPPFVKRAHTLLAPTEVRIATVIGFPFGYAATEAKVAEVVLAMVDGAHELDVVINLTAVKAGDWDFLKKEVQLLAQVIHNKQHIFKLIIETGLLTDAEIIACCEQLAPLGVDYMKTSTGYAEKSATVAAVTLMRTHLPATIQIKASGGIRDFNFAQQLIAAGATRLGCSASVAIVTGDPSFNNSNY